MNIVIYVLLVYIYILKDHKWPCRKIEKEEGKHNSRSSIYIYFTEGWERVFILLQKTINLTKPFNLY